jgi:hypothetical protein
MVLAFIVLNCEAVKHSYTVVDGFGSMCTPAGTSIYKQSIFLKHYRNAHNSFTTDNVG